MRFVKSASNLHTLRRSNARRGRLLAAASLVGAALVGLSVMPSNAAPTAARPSTRVAASRPVIKVLVIGASVTRLSVGDIRKAIPGVSVDAADGRSWTLPGRVGSLPLWDAYHSRRSQLRPGSWLVIENERADVTVQQNRMWIEKLIADLPKGVCLSWVVPHVYYSTQGPAATRMTRQWNDAMALLLHAELAKVPCHSFVEWDSIVREWTATTKGLTAAQIRVGQPLLYDGRHPTKLGAKWYAAAIAAAVRPEAAAKH